MMELEEWVRAKSDEAAQAVANRDFRTALVAMNEIMARGAAEGRADIAADAAKTLAVLQGRVQPKKAALGWVQAVSWARTSRDPQRQIRALSGAVPVLAQSGDLAGAEAFAQDLLTLASELNDPKLHRDALLQLGKVQIARHHREPMSGVIERARSTFDAAIAMTEGDLLRQIPLMLQRESLEGGRVEQLHRLATLAANYGDAYMIAMAWCDLAAAHHRAGDKEAGLAAAQVALEAAESVNDARLMQIARGLSGQ